MNTFQTKTYNIFTPKIKHGPGACFAVLSDLHGIRFGLENQELISAVERANPDAVLVLGDMMVRRESESYASAKELLCALAAHYPVFYALGNHEYKMQKSLRFGEEYRAYEKSLEDAGVHFLHNGKWAEDFSGTRFIFHGLELPLPYYHKPNSPRLTLKTMEELVGTPSDAGVHILLAHNPKYGKTYFNWGADLTLSGHYHGGVLRFNEHVGLTCPQFLLFPPFCCGDFHRGDRHMIVSAGIGEHTIPVRIHNPRELIIVRMKPLEK